MARVLANKNITLIYIPAMVEDTDYEIAGYDNLTLKTGSLNAGTVKKLHNLVSVDGYALGATGEEVVNDPPLAQIGTDENVPGRVNYEGSFNWYQQDTSGAGNPWLAYIRGTGGWLVERRGVAAGTDFSDEDLHVRAFLVTFGVQRDQTPSGAGYFKFAQSVSIGAAYEHCTVADALT